MSVGGPGDDPLVLLLGLLAPLGPQLLGQPVGLVDHGPGLAPGLVDDAAVLRLGLRRPPLGLLGVGQRLADGGLALLHGLADAGQHVLGQDAEHEQERDQLDDERRVGDEEVDEARSTRAQLALGEDEDEQGGEGQVDEVHAFDQTDDQEHGRVQPALDLGLTGDAGDGLATGQAVTDGGADGATAEGETAAGEGAGQLDGLLRVLAMWWISPVVGASSGMGIVGGRTSVPSVSTANW